MEQAVAEYVQFYNYERINMKSGLTPSEFGARPPKPKLFCGVMRPGTDAIVPDPLWER